jgi:hypothetical protein
MSKPATNTPPLPYPGTTKTVETLSRFDQDLVKALHAYLIDLARRANLGLSRDGSEPMEASLDMGGFSISNVANITISGTVTLTSPLPIAQGGTGSTTALGAKTNFALENVDNTTDLNKPISTATQTALDLKAALASPTFTGTPAAPTAASGTDTTQLATTAFVLANSPSIPTTTAGDGQWVKISVGDSTALTLPAGGTWAYFFMTIDKATGEFRTPIITISVAAGGTTVTTTSASQLAYGLAWRIA